MLRQKARREILVTNASRKRTIIRHVDVEVRDRCREQIQEIVDCGKCNGWKQSWRYIISKNTSDFVSNRCTFLHNYVS